MACHDVASLLVVEIVAAFMDAILPLDIAFHEQGLGDSLPDGLRPGCLIHDQARDRMHSCDRAIQKLTDDTMMAAGVIQANTLAFNAVVRWRTCRTWFW